MTFYKTCYFSKHFDKTTGISWDGKHEIYLKELKGVLSQVHNQVIGAKFHYTRCESGSCKSDKVFRNGPSKICERQSFENLKRHALLMLNFAWSTLEYFVSNDDMYDGSFIYISSNFICLISISAYIHIYHNNSNEKKMS